jgi:peptidoglycan-associated lipoprotein
MVMVIKLRFRWAILALVVIGLAACTTPKRGAGANDTGGVASCGCMDLIPNVGDRVFFDFNQSSLNNDALPTLKRQSDWLHKYPQLKILVAGNADERGTEAYNLALGQRRADAVRDELEALGVAAGRIETISYGKDCPVAAGDDAAALQQNRNAITSVQGNNPQNCH